jgi:hypothetical protein
MGRLSEFSLKGVLNGGIYILSGYVFLGAGKIRVWLL